MWTIDTVKDVLPPVRIRIGTQDYTGTIAGRQLPYAMVYVGEVGYPFSWHAITRALNTDAPLHVLTHQGSKRPVGARYTSTKGNCHG
jgi:hypothetical protein